MAGFPDVAEAYEGSDRVVTAVRITTAVVVDGRLDDEAWKAASPVGGFVERTPRLRAVPADKTTVRVLYDAEALYFGVDCADSQPDRIKAVTRSRDAFTIFADDAVTVKLDPAHDHRTTLGFALNPAGAQLDYIAANEGNFQRGWDAIWDGAATRHEGGWSAEWRIPWVALGIDPSAPPAEIGLNLSRDHPRRSATYDWSVMAPPLSPVSSSRYGHIEGLLPVEGASRALELKPYVLLGSETPGDPHQPSIGGDVAIGLGGGWRTQLSVLTDFAQVDVDDQVVNLSRYGLFFPEKRDFFLRDSELFVFGWEGDSQLFHSRTIGIGDDGEVPILGGVKVVGPIGDVGRVGVISVVTQPQGELDWMDNDVLRVSMQSDDGSNAGLMVTRRGNLTTGDAQHVVGLDAAWRGEGTPLLIEGTAMGEPEGGVDQTGATAAMIWRGELFRPSVWYTWFGEDFAPALGFYRRTGVHATRLSMQVEPRIDRAGVQKIVIGAETDQSIYARDAEIWDKRYSMYSNLYWDSGYSLAVTLNQRDEVVDEPFDLLGETPISAGRYVTQQIRINGSTPGTLPFGASGAIRQGGYFGGKLVESGSGIFLRPSPALRLEANALVAQVKFDDPAKRDITAAVINGRIGTALSTSLTLDTFLRWNRLESTASTVVRLRWTYMRGGDLFVVWQSDLDADDGTSQLQSIQAKLTATWSP